MIVPNLRLDNVISVDFVKLGMKNTIDSYFDDNFFKKYWKENLMNFSKDLNENEQENYIDIARDVYDNIRFVLDQKGRLTENVFPDSSMKDLDFFEKEFRILRGKLKTNHIPKEFNQYKLIYAIDCVNEVYINQF